MSERQDSPYDSIARRWLALVERRQEHFIELCDTGRWRHYYTQAEFLDEMRKVLRVREQWASIAGVTLNDDDYDLPLEIGDLVPPRAPPAGMPAPKWPD
jgi:uncharacterized repeat protein (TIGR03809 family)